MLGLSKQTAMKIIIPILVILLIFMGTKMKSTALETIEVKKVNVTNSVIETGQVVSDTEDRIVSESQGVITQVFVNEGSVVKTGQILAVIDSKEIDTQLRQLEGELLTAEGSTKATPSYGIASITQQELSVEKANLGYKKALNDYNRSSQLFQSGGLTKAELDQYKNDLDLAAKELAKAKFSLQSIKNQSQGTSTQLKGQTESILAQIQRLSLLKQKCTIRAMESGKILSKKINKGEYVNIGQDLFLVGDDHNIKIDTYVNADDISGIRDNDTVTVTFKLPGQDEEVPGRIIKIASSTVEQTSALGIPENMVKLSIKLNKNPEKARVISGMNVDVTVTTQRANHVLAVPKDSIFKEGNVQNVWVVKDGKAITQQITTGIEGDSTTEIVKGLALGQHVILNPHNQVLKAGLSVKEMNREY